jgi:hypothetical protein
MELKVIEALANFSLKLLRQESYAFMPLDQFDLLKSFARINDLQDLKQILELVGIDKREINLAKNC